MANVSSSNSQKELVPRLRFPGFTNAWERHRFADVFSILPNNTLSRDNLSTEGAVKNIHYGDVLIKFGDVLNSSDHRIPFIKDVALLGNKVQYLRSGDIIIADTAEDDTVGKACELSISTPDKVVSGLHTIACRPRQGFAPGFLGYYINSPLYHKQLYPYMQGVKVTSISKGNIANTLIDYPDYDEQQQISCILGLVDQRIDRQCRLIDALKSYKRGVSNAIFAHSVGFHHEGESETSTWRVMPFGEVFDFLNSNTLSRADLNYSSGEVKNIHYGDILTKYGAIIDPCSSTVPYINTDAPLSYHKLDYLKTGDIVIADTAEDLTAGKVTEIACANEAKCVSGLHTVACRPRQRFASGYLGHYLNSDYYHRQLLPLIQGTKVSSIARSALVGTHIAFPCLSEQIKVSKCLSLIDTRVEIEERNLDRLVECRKSLLQKLFV